MDLGHFPTNHEQQNLINTGLISSVATGDVEMLQVYLIAGGISQQILNNTLMEALKSDHINSEVMVGLLIQNGAALHPNAQLNDFVSAATMGDVEKVKLYLSAGVGEKALNAALIGAIESELPDSVEIICSLRNNGAYLRDNAIEQFFSVIKAGNYNRVFGFMLAGIEHTQVTNRQGQTALMVAARYGHTQIIEHLCHEGADINAIAQDHYQNSQKTAMDFAAEYAVETGDCTGLSFFIRANAPMTPRLSIGRHGSMENVPFIIWAAYYGFTEIIPLLVTNYGAELDEVDLQTGQTALIWAASRGHTSTAIQLIELGATTDVVDNKGVMLIDLAMNNPKNSELVQYLLTNKYIVADALFLQKAIKSGSLGMVKAAFLAMSDEDKKQVKASSIVFDAVEAGYPGIMHFLLENEFKFDCENGEYKPKYYTTTTPVWLAVYLNKIEVLDVLLNAYALRVYKQNNIQQEKIAIDGDIEKLLLSMDFKNNLANAHRETAFRFLVALPKNRVNELGKSLSLVNVVADFKKETNKNRTKMLAMFGVREKKVELPPVVVVEPEKSFGQNLADSFWSLSATIKKAFGLTTQEPIEPIVPEPEPEPELLDYEHSILAMLPVELITMTIFREFPFWYGSCLDSDLRHMLESFKKVKGERVIPKLEEIVEQAHPENGLEKKPVPVIFSPLNTIQTDTENSAVENKVEDNQLQSPDKPDESKVKIGQP